MGVVAAGKFYVGILVFVVLCCGTLTLMSCPQAPMVGVTGHSRFGSLITLDTVCELSRVHTKRKRKIRICSFYFSVDVIFPCNSNCTCVDYASFDPVCANGTSYYSACHAGCMRFDAQESVS